MAEGFDEIYEYLERRITRKDLLKRTGTVVISGSALSVLAGCGSSEPAKRSTAATGPPKRGGVLRCTDEDLGPLTDPATLSTGGIANVTRQVAEYLTTLDERNLPQPYLLKSIDASPDLKTWTLIVRDGPMFNTPTPRALDADDVVFNLERWLDPKLGSSLTSLLTYLDKSGIEKVDKRTVRLHLKRPTFTLPYDLNAYPAAVLPREFEGDFTKQPWGTGPFSLVTYEAGQKGIVKARGDYWRKGRDGKPLPYLDGIEQVDTKNQANQQLAGVTSGDLQLVNRLDYSTFRQLESTQDVTVASVPSQATLIFRGRADVKPFDDPRVMMALKLCQDRQQIVDLALQNAAYPGTDDMIGKVDPAWPGMSGPAQDLEKAKALLSEAGLPDGFSTELRYLNAPEWHGVACQTFQQQAAKIGVRITLTPMIPDNFWAKWTEWEFAATEWGHRPLAVTTLSLAFECGGAFNETQWCDKEFLDLLANARSMLDMTDRKAAYEAMSEYLTQNAPFAGPLFENTLFAHSDRLKNFKARADKYQFYGDVWLT